MTNMASDLLKWFPTKQNIYISLLKSIRVWRRKIAFDRRLQAPISHENHKILSLKFFNRS